MGLRYICIQVYLYYQGKGHTLFAYWVSLHFYVVCCFFSNINYFEKNILGIPSECQTVWIQIRLNVLSGLSLIQTICKGYQIQVTLMQFLLYKNILHCQRSRHPFALVVKLNNRCTDAFVTLQFSYTIQ